MKLIPLPAFTDNYIWMLHDGQAAWVVDPGDAAPVLQALAANGLTALRSLVARRVDGLILCSSGGGGEIAQEIAARNFYRPIDPAVAAKYEKNFPKINLFTIDAVFGGWTKAQKTHFADGGVFDQIYTKK